jgi:hypothetical protein
MSEQETRRLLRHGNTSRRIWLQPAWSNGQGFVSSSGLRRSMSHGVGSNAYRSIGETGFLTMLDSHHRSL